MFVRIKCTVTERGRVINLKQANYKTVKICGRARKIDCKEGEAGLSGTVFLGLVSLTGPQPGLQSQLGVFNSRHSQDMKFVEVDPWFSSSTGYESHCLMGQSLFDYIHTGDIHSIQTCFRSCKLKMVARLEIYSHDFSARTGIV